MFEEAVLALLGIAIVLLRVLDDANEDGFARRGMRGSGSGLIVESRSLSEEQERERANGK